MIGLIQRVSSAQVAIEQQTVANMGTGIMALVAVQEHDTDETIKRMTQRIISYRIFPDEAGKMNLSLKDIQGELLLVPQFTLIADTKAGNRPSFSSKVTPEFGLVMFTKFLENTQNEYSRVQHGQFGADMQVSLVNDGPVTFWLEV